MRCFTDGEIRRGIVAVVQAVRSEADLFEVFLLGAATTTPDDPKDDLTRSDRVGIALRETTQRRDG